LTTEIWEPARAARCRGSSPKLRQLETGESSISAEKTEEEVEEVAQRDRCGASIFAGNGSCRRQGE
jgi:hypothetical protein